MGELSNIGWCHHTFNPWIGCSHVSPGCRNCYAEAWARRYGFDVFRRKGPRKITSGSYWSQPARWNRLAAEAGVRERVFCASLADVFEDHPAVGPTRLRLWKLIAETPALDWLLLTKRPENIARLVPWSGDWPRNVWIGTSVERQRQAGERIPVLLEAAANAAVRFLSCEPLLGRVDLGDWLVEETLSANPDDDPSADCMDAPDGAVVNGMSRAGARWERVTYLDWVIIGGESGPGHRRMAMTWLTDLHRQCDQARVPVYVKQDSGPAPGKQGRIPDGLWTHQFPRPVAA